MNTNTILKPSLKDTNPDSLAAVFASAHTQAPTLTARAKHQSQQIQRMKAALKKANARHNKTKTEAARYNTDLKVIIKLYCYDETSNTYKPTSVIDHLKTSTLWPKDDATNNPLGIKKLLSHDDPAVKALGKAANSLSARCCALNKKLSNDADSIKKERSQLLQMLEDLQPKQNNPVNTSKDTDKKKTVRIVKPATGKDKKDKVSELAAAIASLNETDKAKLFALLYDNPDTVKALEYERKIYIAKKMAA